MPLGDHRTEPYEVSGTVFPAIKRRFWTRAQIEKVARLVAEGLLCPACIGRQLSPKRTSAAVRSICYREDIPIHDYLKDD